MSKLIEDVSNLTCVSENTLRKFIPTINYCIGHALYESLCIQEEYLRMDIGVGELQIKCDNESVRYRFIPSKELEGIVVTAAKGQSPIAVKLEDDLQAKIDKAYKELLC